ncbi:MAG: tyrosine-type recombinase/integrase [Moorea sp. SIO4E2]|uniref:tyrosine-type recombinase/integrase n=1 Tax=Moorena sp. SIO4E2 TaxID=2607826 RepID=UPI0013B7A6BE|nr:tyrosine-type recombinase/integrase [Moorena sp. SIO4E2]NEQ11215.1 tyrosine-type recombinase/integrase [Moorena sp. SIO4E2]
MRRGELVKLELKDFNPENGALLVRGGKGGKDRTVYLPELAIAYLKDWLTIRRHLQKLTSNPCTAWVKTEFLEMSRGDSPGALLCPIQNGGRIEFRHMTSQAVLLIMRKRAKQAGVEPTFRRLDITAMVFWKHDTNSIFH